MLARSRSPHPCVGLPLPSTTSSIAVPWHARGIDEALKRLATRLDGLTEADARDRLRSAGPNALTRVPPVSSMKILIDQFRSVVVALLVVAAAIAGGRGDWLDAAAIAGVLIINIALAFIIELRGHRAIEQLLRLEGRGATVIRDHHVRDVDAQTIVPGDVLAIEAGQTVAADARIAAASELRIDESALTGESVTVGKHPTRVLDEATPLADRINMAHAGSTVVSGTGRAVVVATGMATELGRIQRLVGTTEEQRTPLERRLDALGRGLVWLTLVVCALVFALGVLEGVPLAAMLSVAIALAIAAVPEGLPAIATVTLALGVRRMARRRALIRRLPSVETLGSVTVVCTDKTGTLTAGAMTVTAMCAGGQDFAVSGVGFAPEGHFSHVADRVAIAELTPALHVALQVAALANRADLFEVSGGWAVRGDPTEAALLTVARKGGVDRDRLLEEWPEVGEVPFTSERHSMATFHRRANNGVFACVKGAPHRVLELCTRHLTPAGETQLDGDAGDRHLAANANMASSGLRVLAFAYGPVSAPHEAALHGLTFVGLAGMIDPPAPGVVETIRAFDAAGIRTVMLTGDQKLTAQAVARELGLTRAGGDVLDGADVERLSDVELGNRVPRVAAFTRLSPEAKLRVVAALQQRGEIVAMLGDGVNDAAALKKADVGVAMGVRGTDAAKATADVVLQDDRFQTIATAVEEGRVIFDNIAKFVFYLFSCNLAEILVVFGAELAGLPLPLLPIQLLWLNLVTDTFPAFALAFEPGDPTVMRRPPRNPQAEILSAPFLRRVVFYGAIIAGSTLAVAVWGSTTHADPSRVATMNFTLLALAQIFHLGNARSSDAVVAPRRAMANGFALGAVAVALILQGLAIYYPPLARVVHTYPLSLQDWLVIVPLSLVAALVGQTIKVLRAR